LNLRKLRQTVPMCVIAASVAMPPYRVWLMSDKLFTRQYTWQQVEWFVAQFPHNMLTLEQRQTVYTASVSNLVNPLLIYAKMQCESGVVANLQQEQDYDKRLHRCMGYGMGHREKRAGDKATPWGSFTKQVEGAAAMLRHYYDAWESGIVMELNRGDVLATPLNGSTYAILQYTPFLGKNRIYGYNSNDTIVDYGHVAGAELTGTILSNYIKLMNGGSR